MDWLKIATGFPEHRKVQELKAILSEPLAEAYALRIMAWLARNNSQDGMVGAPFVLEDVARWRGDQGVLASAMLKVGLVRQTKGGLQYHDWQDHNGVHIGAHQAKLERDRERLRATRRGDVAATSFKSRNTRTNSTNERTNEHSTQDSGEAGKPAPPLAASLVSVGGYQVSQEVLTAWIKAYPGISIEAECLKAHAWETANPKNRKVNKVRFLQNWLARAQDSASRPTIQPPRRFAAGGVVPMSQEERDRDALRDARMEWDARKRGYVREFFNENREHPTDAQVVSRIGVRP